MKRFLGPLAIILVIMTGLGYLLANSEEARDVTVSGVTTLFGFLTTPFILETSVALMGLVAVMTYNQWRMERDGDEWVEMEVPVKSEPEQPTKP